MLGLPEIVCCSVWQCVAVCCSALQCVVVCRSVSQCVVVCCSVWQCVAACRADICMNRFIHMLAYRVLESYVPGGNCVLQCVAARCSVSC